MPDKSQIAAWRLHAVGSSAAEQAGGVLGLEAGTDTFDANDRLVASGNILPAHNHFNADVEMEHAGPEGQPPMLSGQYTADEGKPLRQPPLVSDCDAVLEGHRHPLLIPAKPTSW